MAFALIVEFLNMRLRNRSKRILPDFPTTPKNNGRYTNTEGQTMFLFGSYSMFPFVTRLLAFLLAVSVINSCATAQDERDMPQSWQGLLDVGAAKLRIRFDIKKDEKGNLACDMISVDQGNTKIPMESCEIKGNKLTISTKGFGNIKFEGVYKKDGSRVKGTFSQAGRSFEMSLKPADDPGKTKLVETWQGTMVAGPQTFEFQFRVLQGKDNKKLVELDSFSENLGGLNVDPTFDDDGVKFEITLTKATFVGKYNDDKTELKGNWLQSGGKFPLDLKKVDLSDTREVEPPNRPQTPKKPFPYRSENVKFENEKDKITLAGTLTMPKSDGPFSAAVLITGSGPQDRDESLMGHKPFLVLADHLTKAGIAVLRYDERGVGKSTGDFKGSNSKDLARDVEAAIEFLKQRDDIDSNKIGLIGHSEGGLSHQ